MRFARKTAEREVVKAAIGSRPSLYRHWRDEVGQGRHHQGNL